MCVSPLGDFPINSHLILKTSHVADSCNDTMHPLTSCHHPGKSSSWQANTELESRERSLRVQHLPTHSKANETISFDLLTCKTKQDWCDWSKLASYTMAEAQQRTAPGLTELLHKPGLARELRSTECYMANMSKAQTGSSRTIHLSRDSMLYNVLLYRSPGEFSNLIGQTRSATGVL